MASKDAARVHEPDGVPELNAGHPTSCACADVQQNAFTGHISHSTGPFSSEQNFKTPEWSRYDTLVKSGVKTLGEWLAYRDAQLAKKSGPQIKRAPTGHQELQLGNLSGRNAKAFRVVKP